MSSTKPYSKQSWFDTSTANLPERTLSDKQSEFIDWLLNPSTDKGTQSAWAVAHDISIGSLSNWKKSRLFRDAWERRAMEINGGVERTQLLVDKMFDMALSGDVKAMSLYLAYLDRTTPKKLVVIEDGTAKDMTDDELAAALRESADNITNIRKGA